MKIKFIIYSHFFKERGMSVKGDWNFPHLPRIGEEISPHIIMFQNEFTYQNLLEYLTNEAKNDLINSMIMRVIWKEILKHGYMMLSVRSILLNQYIIDQIQKTIPKLFLKFV